MAPLSPEEILPMYEFFEKHPLTFGKNITITRGVFPFKLTYLPFFEQLSIQLTELLKQYTTKNFMRYFDFAFRTRYRTHYGEPYTYKYIMEYHSPIKYSWMKPECLMESTEYRGEFFKFHKDGFAYGVMGMSSKIASDNSAFIWLRWKSNLPGYEYIEPDDELDLKAEDITFEICDRAPDEFLLRLFAKTSDEFDFNVWKELINDEECYPKKRNSKKKKNFPYEISENCAYPDVIVSIFLSEKITESIKEILISELASFQAEWDSSHDTGIHYMDIMDEEDNNNLIKIAIDFGDNDPDIIEALINYMRSSKLNIKNVVIQ